MVDGVTEICCGFCCPLWDGNVSDFVRVIYLIWNNSDFAKYGGSLLQRWRGVGRQSLLTGSGALATTVLEVPP